MSHEPCSSAYCEILCIIKIDILPCSVQPIVHSRHTYRLEIDVEHTCQDPPHPSLSQIFAGVSALEVWEVCFANHFAISGDIHSSSVTSRVAAVSLYSLMIDTQILKHHGTCSVK